MLTSSANAARSVAALLLVHALAAAPPVRAQVPVRVRAKRTLTVGTLTFKAFVSGGANPVELDLLAFSDMARARSWKVSPSLEDLRAVMREVGPERPALAIDVRRPFVLDEGSGLRNAGAIVATLGVRDAALMDVLTGKFRPQGKLPFALAANAQAIVWQAADAPGSDRGDALVPFGFGLSS